MPSNLIAGDAVTGVQITSGNDGALNIQVGPNGSKVTAVSISASGIVQVFGGAAAGGGTDRIFYENDQTVNSNYTITATKNAMSAGPITIANGIVVTINTGGNWAIV